MAEQASCELDVPAAAVSALKGKCGAKVKDMEATSGAVIDISKPKEGDAWTVILVSGSKEAVNIASLLIKMAILHARSADQVATPSLYKKDKAAEARLNMAAFHREVIASAFSTKFPRVVQCNSNK